MRRSWAHSRDRRSDLKPLGRHRVGWNDGAIPALLELADGHQSAKAHFAGLRPALKSQWNFEGLYVADAALYSEETLQQRSGFRWLTRVPLTRNTASALVNQVSASAFERTDLEGYRIKPVCCDGGGVRQQWCVVEGQERQTSDLRKLEPTLAQAKNQAQAQCRPSLVALKRFEQTLP